METSRNRETINKELEDFIKGSVPINTAFSNSIAQAIMKYQKDKGYLFPQDVIRLAVSTFLSKTGYLNNNS